MSSAMPSILCFFSFFLLYPRFLFQIYIPGIPEAGILAFFIQNPEKMLDLLHGLRMHQIMAFPFQEINQWVVLGIFFFIIHFGCCDPVCQHLCHIFFGHSHATHGMILIIDLIINPIFKMMLVPALVMKPGGGISFILPLCIIRASVSLIIFGSHQELGWHVF